MFAVARFAAVALTIFSFVSSGAHADDWPQWMGPQRDGVWREAGVIDQVPAAGLPAKWRAEVGYGYASPAVAAGKVYLFDYVVKTGEVKNLPSTRDKLTGVERLTCYDAATGDIVWQKQYDCAYNVSYGGGPRCTPTVDGDHVYTLGTEGDLVCRTAADGTEVWRKNFLKEYGAVTPIWGHSSHPLVVGDLVCCVVGGEGSVAVAWDKLTGEERWKNLTAGEPGYCPPKLINHAGVEQLLIWHPESLNALNPATGQGLWSIPMRPSYGMSVNAPAKFEDRLYVGAIGNLSVLMKLDNEKPDAEVVWSGDAKRGVRCVNVTPIMAEGVIYGVDCETSELMAVSQDDGRRLWVTKQPTIGNNRGRHGTAFLTHHQPTGVTWLFNETGELISAKLSPEKYEETGRTKLLEPTSSTFGRPVVWSHPAYAEKCVFVRNDKELVCVSLAK